MVHTLVSGRASDALFPVWPFAVPADPLALPPLQFTRQYRWTPSLLLEVVLRIALAAVGV